MTTTFGTSSFAAARSPEPGECAACGFTPAAETTFRRLSGYVLFFRDVSETASYCRGCALDAYRRCQAWNIGRGWWSLYSSVLTVIVLVSNARQMRALRRLPSAFTRAPEVTAARTAPSDGGPLVWQRPNAYVLFLVLALWIGANVAF